MVLNAYEGWKNAQKKTDTVMFCHKRKFHEEGIFCAMNNTEMKVQMRQWRNFVKRGLLTIRFVNSKERTLEDGMTWYWFVVQPTNPTESDIDSLGAFLLGEMVSGFIYCFKSKQNRDRVQEYIMKGFEQMPFHTEEELEEKYGNIEEELGELGNIEIN
jgi:hypothetical protein